MLREDLQTRLDSSNTFQDPMPKVYLVGSIGAGKTSLLRAIHRSLGYRSAGIEIANLKRKTPEELEEQRNIGINRANATVHPEELLLFGYDSVSVKAATLYAEGSHIQTEKLWDLERPLVSKPDILVHLIDHAFLLHLSRFSLPSESLELTRNVPHFERMTSWVEERFERSWETIQSLGTGSFKNELDFHTYLSLLHSMKQVAFAKYLGIPVVPVLSNYRSEFPDTAGLFDDIQEKMKARTRTTAITDREWRYLVNFSIGEEILYPLEFQEVSSGAIPVDSYAKPNPTGIEDVAYNIVRSAFGPNTKLVSFRTNSHSRDKVISFGQLNAP